MNPLLLKAAPYLGIAALLAIGKCGYDANQREIGAMKERLKTTDSALVVARAAALRLDSVFIRDTVRLTRRIVSTQTLLDTLRLSDTVTLTKRESVLVFVADSLVQQCRTTVSSCSARVANLTEQLSLTTTQRDAYRKLVPSGFQSARSTITTAAVVGVACYLFCPRR